QQAEREPAGGGQGRGGPQRRNPAKKREQVAQDDGFQGGAVLLLAQQDGHGGKSQATGEGDREPGEMADLQSLVEKHPEAAEDGGDGQPVGPRGAFAQQPGAEQRNPDRRRVLEQNGIGRRRQLVGQGEQDGAGGIGGGR